MQRAIDSMLACALLALPLAAHAFWSPVQPISASPMPARLQYNWGRAIAMDGAGVAHVAWLEVASPDPPGHGSGRVMYSRSGDDGRSWAVPRPLTGLPVPVTGNPKVAAAGSHVYVVWHGLHDGSGRLKILVMRSPDHGSTWEPPRAIGEEAAWPSVAACGHAVHVVWSDHKDGAAEVRLRSSADAGSTWSETQQVSSPDGRSSWVPAVACWGAQIHVAWSDERDNVDAEGNAYDCGLAQDNTQCREEEYYRRSMDFGRTWETEQRLTFDPPDRPHASWAPSLAVWGGNVHLAFFDARGGQFEAYYMRSTAGGAPFTWEAERIVSPPGGTTRHARPVVAALGPFIHIVWFAVTYPIGVEVWHARSFDNGASFRPPETLTRAPTGSESHPSVAISPYLTAHVIWYEPDVHGVDQIVHRARRLFPSFGLWD